MVAVVELSRTTVRLSAESKAKIVELYRDLVPVEQIAARFQVDRRTVRGLAKAAGLEPHPRGLAVDGIPAAAARYQAGASLATVGSEFGVDAETVRNVFKSCGIPIRPRRGWSNTNVIAT